MTEGASRGPRKKISCVSSQSCNTVIYNIYCSSGHPLGGLSKRWSPSICLSVPCPSRSLAFIDGKSRHADSNYFAPLSVRSSIVADGHIMFFFSCILLHIYRPMKQISVGLSAEPVAALYVDTASETVIHLICLSLYLIPAND